MTFSLPSTLSKRDEFLENSSGEVGKKMSAPNAAEEMTRLLRLFNLPIRNRQNKEALKFDLQYC